MEYKNEMLDALVGKPVVVGLVKTPDLDEEAVASMREDPTFGMTELVQSVRASFGYGGLAAPRWTVHNWPSTNARKDGFRAPRRPASTGRPAAGVAVGLNDVQGPF